LKFISVRRLPKVLVNFAITADGKTSTRCRTPSGFTSSRDKRRLSEIRALGDALLVGRNTVATDGMGMGISSPDLRAERMAAGKPPSPLRIIVSARGRFDVTWKVFANSDSPLILCTADKIPERTVKRFPSFVKILEFPKGKIPIEGLLGMLLARWGVRKIVCEGGPSLFKSLLQADVVDELYLTVAPVIFGGNAAVSLTGLPEGFLPQERRFRLKSLETQGGEAYLHYHRDRRGSSAARN
jgi:riboflavin-specific deaminase-like protein